MAVAFAVSFGKEEFDQHARTYRPLLRWDLSASTLNCIDLEHKKRSLRLVNLEFGQSNRIDQTKYFQFSMVLVTGVFGNTLNVGLNKAGKGDASSAHVL